MQCRPGGLPSAQKKKSIAAPITATIGRGALAAVTRMATTISPIASRTVPTGAATTEAEVS